MKLHPKRFSLFMLYISFLAMHSISIANPQKTLFRAAKEGNHLIVQSLLTNKTVDVNATNDYGQSALMSACYAGQTREAQLLIVHGANMDAADNRGASAIIHAAGNFQSEAVWLLLENGAKIPTKKEMEKAKLPEKAKKLLGFSAYKKAPLIKRLPLAIEHLILDFTFNKDTASHIKKLCLKKG